MAKDKKETAPETHITGEPAPISEAAAQQAKYKYIINNKTVEKRLKQKKTVTVILIVLLVIALLGALLFSTLTFVESNSFKIAVDADSVSGMSVSKDSAFSAPSATLSMEGPEKMLDKTLADFWRRIDEWRELPGSAAERDKSIGLMAFTLFVRNDNNKEITYRESIEISDVTKGMDAAARILVVRDYGDGDESIKVYAKERADGTAEEVVPNMHFTEEFKSDEKGVVWMTLPFKTSRFAFYNEDCKLKPNGVVKYTVVIWLEGEDSDCVDRIIGGTMKAEMRFALVR